MQGGKPIGPIPPATELSPGASATELLPGASAAASPVKGQTDIKGALEGNTMEAFDRAYLETVNERLARLPESPEAYLGYAVWQADQKRQKGTSESQDLISLLDGTALAEAKQQWDDIGKQVNDAIEQLNRPLIQYTRDSYEKKIDADIQDAKTKLADGSFSRITNPNTGQSFTREEWEASVAAMEQNKHRNLVESGVRQDPWENIATLIAMAANPKSAAEYSAIPTALAQQRFEVTQNNLVRAYEANQRAYTMKLNWLQNQSQYWQSVIQSERQFQERAKLAIFEADKSFDSLKYQLENQNWQLAVREAGDTLNSLQQLPPDMIRSAAKRYNNIIRFANSQNSELQWGEFSEDDIERLVQEAEYKRRQAVVAQVLDNYYKLGKTFETITPEDKKWLSTLLFSAGPLWDGKVRREITLDDLGLKVESKPTQQTQASKAAREQQQEQFNRRQAESERHNKAMEADSDARISISRSKGSTKKPDGLTKIESAKTALATTERGLSRAAKALRDSPYKSLLNPDGSLKSMSASTRKKPEIAAYIKAKEAVDDARDSLGALQEQYPDAAKWVQGTAAKVQTQGGYPKPGRVVDAKFAKSHLNEIPNEVAELKKYGYDPSEIIDLFAITEDLNMLLQGLSDTAVMPLSGPKADAVKKFVLAAQKRGILP